MHSALCLWFVPRALRSYWQSEPWYSVSGPGYDLGYGVVDTVSRLPSGNAFRKAGDAAFPFAFFAFLAQIYVTFAVTLRFLGRNDGCSGRLPHSLKVWSRCPFFALCVGLIPQASQEDRVFQRTR